MIKEKILFVKDLPEEIIKDIMNYAYDCSVALIGFSENNSIIRNVIASGTLISIQNKFGVLTAKHVWEMFKNNKEVSKINFSILQYPHSILEHKNYFNPVIPNDEIDICFLELPDHILNTIKAYKIFFPIKCENFTIIDQIKKNIWFTCGYPNELISHGDNILTAFRYFTNLVGYKYFDNGYDELELIVSYKNSNEDKMPSTFAGMSGGGIWNFKIFINEESGKIEIGKNQAEKLLVGVNYYQTSVIDGERKIKGMGPVSIYKNLYNIVRSL